MNIDKIIREKYHGFSDEQWGELKNIFPYSEIQFIVKNALEIQKQQSTDQQCNVQDISDRFSNDELERIADECFLAITSYSPRNELGGIERKWIIKCIYKVLKVVNDR